MEQPFIIIIAGPNGVGKSTFARFYLELIPECVEIVDPDVIARTLTEVPENDRAIRAGRIAIERVRLLIELRFSFAIETTLSGKTLAAALLEAAGIGYYIAIKLLRVETIRVSSARVAKRVQQGGHDIPMASQVRRFTRSYDNFFTYYFDVCHEWTIYDAESEQPQLLLTGRGKLSED
jgi:predicted ABC-type ATPase